MGSEFEAIIVGGGPAGSAAAALLSMEGMSVCLVEKELYPRFHIGESLLPAGNTILRKIGVWDDLHKQGFIQKRGAEFTVGDGRRRVHNIFADGFLPGMDYTFQVTRSRFDKLLLDNARKLGCEVVQPARVVSAERKEGSWLLNLERKGHPDQAVSARWLIDAAGRSRFLGSRLDLEREEVPVAPRFAVFNHFRGVPRREGPEGGNITVVRVEDGWFWIIPLDAETTSVGVVKLRRPGQLPPGEAFFWNEVRESPVVSRRMRGAEALDKWRVEADFSYFHKSFAGEDYLLLGDAAGFIDPVFSSGVYLGMESASLAASTLLGPARTRGRLTPREQRRYTHSLRRRMDVMLSLVRVFYHPRDFSVFMSPTQRFSLFPAINSVVAGNTDLTFPLRWRFNLFLLICRINRILRFLPVVKLKRHHLHPSIETAHAPTRKTVE